MAVSSCRSALLRYSMTLGSPFMCTLRYPPETPVGYSKSKERNGFQPALTSGIRRAAVAAGLGGTEGFVHDLADGAGAAAALGAAAETAVDLPGRAWPGLRRDDGADIVVAENVAGADNHQPVPRA